MDFLEQNLQRTLRERDAALAAADGLRAESEKLKGIGRLLVRTRLCFGHRLLTILQRCCTLEFVSDSTLSWWQGSWSSCKRGKRLGWPRRPRMMAAA